MVSFSCEGCGDVLTKKKLDQHQTRCRGATFTCLDCMVHFPGTEYRAHTSCITEEQKYQGSSYKNKNKKAKTSDTASAPSSMARSAYVEDAPDEYEEWKDYEVRDTDGDSIGDPLPEAPTPPNADDANVNVFDFLVANGTPTASNVSLPPHATVDLSEETRLVRYDYDANAYLDPLGHVVDAEAMVTYGTGPIPTSSYKTPAAKGERRKIKEVVKDKKRKRLQLDILERDHVMTDAPPVLHSGLTGGINRLMSRNSVFPPSPDYSGGDAADTPASPLKKTRHSKHGKVSRTEAISTSLMAMLSSGPAAKPKTKVKTSKKRKQIGSTTKKHHRHHHRQHQLEAPNETKLIEYRPMSSGSGDEEQDSKQMVVYRPRAELFMSFISKGPDSERGYSMNKALKRFHRERSASSQCLSKLKEEKELWRSLRMKRNDRGEIVLFCIEE